MDFNGLMPVQMYCPNCGQKVTGYKSEDGAVRMICPRCRVKLFSKRHNKKELHIKVMVAVNTNT